MATRIALFAAGLHGAVSVALAAYAAHGMADEFSPQAIGYVALGSQFQLVHAAALVGAVLVMGRASRGWARAAAAVAVAGFALGPVLFSGALYGVALTGSSGFGRFAPFGGAAMIIGWLGLAFTGILWRPTRANPAER